MRGEAWAILAFAAFTLVPLGRIAAAWATADGWSQIAALRAAARQIACGVPLMLSLVPVVMIVGSLDPVEIVAFQSGLVADVIPRWFVWLLAPSLVIFLVAALYGFDQTLCDTVRVGEKERSPEALVSYVTLLVASSLVITLFFGGWTVPFVPQLLPAPVSALVFVAKLSLAVYLLARVRRVLPRLRSDQLLDLGWKWLTPIALAWVLLVGFVIKLAAPGGAV